MFWVSVQSTEESPPTGVEKSLNAILSFVITREMRDSEMDGNGSETKRPQVRMIIAKELETVLRL